MSTNAPTIYPWLRYRDARAAIAWLERAFGARVLMLVDGPEGSVAHAELALGEGIVMVGSGGEDPGGREALGVEQAPFGVYAWVADVDAHHARAREAGARITRAPGDTDYGSREYCAVDPGGHHWSFGTYRPAVPLG